MKRSGQVRLLISASLLAGATVATLTVAGCDQRVRNLADDGFDPNRTYLDNTYYPNLGYYHAGAHWFFPHPVNYFLPGQGYYYGGSWFPLAQAMILSSQPDSSRAFAYLAERRRRDNQYGDGTGFSGGGGYPGVHGGYGSSFSETGVSRGGFGEAGHAASGHGGGE